MLFKLLLCCCYFVVYVKSAVNPVIFTFAIDDTYDDGLNIAKIIEQKNWFGSYFLNSQRLSLHKQHLTRIQVNKLFTSGHEIAGHTMTHASLLSSSTAQINLQTCVDRGFLEAFKWNVTSFAYPYALVNDALVTMIKKCNYCNARSGSQGLWDPVVCSNCPAGDTYPPNDAWRIKSYSVKVSDTFEALKTRINRAIDESSNGNNRWVIFNFHKLCEKKCNTHSDYGTPLSVFQEFVNYLSTLENQQQLKVQTMKNVMTNYGNLMSCNSTVPDEFAVYFNSDNISILDGVINDDGTCSNSGNVVKIQWMITLICIFLLCILV
jgi:hypothetical protein